LFGIVGATHLAEHIMKPVVGELRAQAAYKSSDSPVVIVSADPAVQKLNLQVVEFYPDTDGTFKIKVQSGVEDSIRRLDAAKV
jgi:hypothetical protein